LFSPDCPRRVRHMIKRALERSAHGSFQNLIWCRGNSVELRQHARQSIDV